MNIDEKIIQIFIASQDKIKKEIEIALKQWKSVDYLKSKLVNIIEELKISRDSYISLSAKENYIEWLVYYDKEAKQILKESKSLAIQEREQLENEYIVKIWWVSKEVVNNLVKQWNNYMQQNLNNMLNWILWQFSNAKIEQLFTTLWEWETQWKSWFEISKLMSKHFDNVGIVDKWWKTWTIERYTQMLVRTETAKAKNTATLTRGKELWITKYKRIEHSNCCPLCIPHRNEVVDIKDWMPYLILHPNCRGYREPIF